MNNIIIILVLLLVSCRENPNKTIQVNLAGSLKEVMHQGQLGSQVYLDTLAKPGVYALGALDSLSGEVLIEDGQVWISKVIDDHLRVHQNPRAGAALLVYSEVKEWAELEVSATDLDELLLAESAKMSLSAPFPFIIKGSFPRLQYHVINYDAQGGSISQHKQGALEGQLSRQIVNILGFYSREHQGLFTHHGSYTHMHVRTPDGDIMGHVDEIELGNGTFTLLLPKS